VILIFAAPPLRNPRESFLKGLARPPRFEQCACFETRHDLSPVSLSLFSLSFLSRPSGREPSPSSVSHPYENVNLLSHLLRHLFVEASRQFVEFFYLTENPCNVLARGSLIAL